MAQILYRVMCQRLKLASSELSPESALAGLRGIQPHTVRIHSGTPIPWRLHHPPCQTDILAALNVWTPTHDARITLL